MVSVNISCVCTQNQHIAYLALHSTLLRTPRPSVPLSFSCIVGRRRANRLLAGQKMNSAAEGFLYYDDYQNAKEDEACCRYYCCCAVG